MKKQWKIAVFLCGTFCYQLGYSAPLKEVLPSLMQGSLGGAAVFIKKDHPPEYYFHGYQDPGYLSPINKNSVFRVASVSKIFLALTAAQFSHERGDFLDEDIRPFLMPSLKAAPLLFSSPITLRNLLEHTSGLQEVILPWPDSRSEALLPMAEIIQQFASSAVKPWKVGERAVYSNFNYLLAAAALESKFEKGFEKLVEQKIVGPLKMQKTTYKANEVQEKDLAVGFHLASRTEISHGEFYYRSAAGLFSTPSDLGQLLQMLINGGKVNGKQVIAKAALDELQKTQTTPAANAGIKQVGSGFGAMLREKDKRFLVGHNGFTDGYMAALFYNDQAGYGFAVMLNAHPYPPSPSLNSIIKAIIEAKTAPEKPRSVPHGGSHDFDLLPFTGFYRLSNPRFPQLSFFNRLTEHYWVEFEEGDALLSKAFGSNKKLRRHASHLFKEIHEHEASYAFISQQDGQKALIKHSDEYFVQSSFAAWLFAVASTLFATLGFAAWPILAAINIYHRKYRWGWPSVLQLAAFVSFAMIFLPFLGFFTIKDITQFSWLTASQYSFSIGFAVFTVAQLGVLGMKSRQTYERVFCVASAAWLWILWESQMIGLKFWE